MNKRFIIPKWRKRPDLLYNVICEMQQTIEGATKYRREYEKYVAFQIPLLGVSKEYMALIIEAIKFFSPDIVEIEYARSEIAFMWNIKYHIKGTRPRLKEAL